MVMIKGHEEAKADLAHHRRTASQMESKMATQTITKGQVQFNGVTLEMGEPVLVDGRKGVPFMAWIRDGMSNLPAGFTPKPSTTVRFKWEGTYMPSDFVTNFGRQPIIEKTVELAAA